MNLSRKARFASLALFAFFLFGSKAYASGPVFESYIYTPEDIDARIGYFPTSAQNPPDITGSDTIILPNLGPQYLYPVYQNLIGRDLSPSAKAALASYYSGVPLVNLPAAFVDAVTMWENARAKINNVPTSIGIYKADNSNSYSGSYVNCLPDAFLTAAKTLESRESSYTKDELGAWVANQDKVFDQCGDPADNENPPYPYYDNYYSGTDSVLSTTTAAAPAVIGNMLNAGMPSFWQGMEEEFRAFWNWIFGSKAEAQQHAEFPALITPATLTHADLFGSDRSYQEAAGLFYSGDLDAAAEKFSAIAASASPWKAYAAVAVGRVHLRKALSLNLSSADSQAVNSEFQLAKNQFDQIIADPTLSPVHPAAQELRTFALMHLDFAAAFAEASKSLASAKTADDSLRHLDDFVAAWNALGNSQDGVLRTAAMNSGSDFAEWAYVWDNGTTTDSSFVLGKYQEKKSLPWLLASLRFVPASSPESDTILNDALNVSPGSLGYWTARLSRIRLLIARGYADKARQEADSLSRGSVPPIVSNYLENFKMLLADNLNDAFSHSERKIISEGWDGSSLSLPSEPADTRVIDDKAAAAYEHSMPLSKETDIALAKSIFTSKVAENVRLTTLTRAILLGDYAKAESLAQSLAAASSTLQADLSAFIVANDPNQQKFEAAFFLLHYPTLGVGISSDLLISGNLKEIDEYAGDRWDYCAVSGGYDPSHDPSGAYDLSFADKLLSSDDLVQAKSENVKLGAIQSSDYFISIVMDYAQLHPNDPRIPEALHLAVLVSRYSSCKDAESSILSEQAHDFLQAQYGNTDWAKKTPYSY